MEQSPGLMTISTSQSIEEEKVPTLSEEILSEDFFSKLRKSLDLIKVGKVHRSTIFNLENQLLIDNIQKGENLFRGFEFKQQNNDTYNVFFGLGMWSHINGLSLGIPTDIISILAMCFHLLNNSKGQIRFYILIADQLAKDCAHQKYRQQPSAEEKIQKIIVEQVEEHCKIIAELFREIHLGPFEIWKESELDQIPEYRSLFGEIKDSQQWKSLNVDRAHVHYFHRQLCDMEYFVRTKNVSLKISWAGDAEESSMSYEDYSEVVKACLSKKKFDEVIFDAAYRIICPSSQLKFVYCKSGRPKNERKTKLILTDKGKISNIAGLLDGLERLEKSDNEYSLPTPPYFFS